MAWTIDTAIQAQNLIAQISTELQNGGWTLYDNVANAPVLSSTNNQGATQYLQVSQSGSYTYIQLQAWKSWNSGTHVGTTGSSTSYGRLYLGGSPISATTTCDLYMSVTSNRANVHINSTSTNYRAWGYFGGLGTMAGTNDPSCVLLLSSYEAGLSYNVGQMLLSAGGGSANWGSCKFFALAWSAQTADATARHQADNGDLVQQVGPNGGQVFLSPIICADSFIYTTGFNTGVGTLALRGDLDGLLFCPLGSSAGDGAANGAASGSLGHLDTVTVGGTTYLVIQPGGTPTANVHLLTGNYGGGGLAIAEV